jgi:hypothetical protein
MNEDLNKSAKLSSSSCSIRKKTLVWREVE